MRKLWVRTHACDAEVSQALGRSEGGFSTKIHVLVNALGNPLDSLDFIITGGQAADVTQALPLLEGQIAQQVLLDNGVSIQIR